MGAVREAMSDVIDHRSLRQLSDDSQRLIAAYEPQPDGALP